MTFHDLPGPVREAVLALALDVRRAGGQLWVFGSLARGDARPNSDLDLGVLPPPSADPALLPGWRRRAARLPTIRPVDFVDVRELEPAFRQSALTQALAL